MEINTNQGSPPVGPDWVKELPSPTSPFTMSFPNTATDEDLNDFFRDFQADDGNMHFESLVNEDGTPISMYDILGPDNDGPAAPLNVSDNQLIQGSERHPAYLNTKNGAHQHSNNGLGGLDTVAATLQDKQRGQSAILETSSQHSDAAGTNYGLDIPSGTVAQSDTLHDSVVGLGGNQHGNLDALEANASASNPDLAQKDSGAKHNGQPDMDRWDAVNDSTGGSPTDNSLDCHTALLRSNSLQPDSGASNQNTSIVGTELDDLHSWDAINDSIHTMHPISSQNLQHGILNSGPLQSTEILNVISENLPATSDTTRATKTNQGIRNMGDRNVGAALFMNDQRGQQSTSAAQRIGSKKTVQGEQLSTSMSPTLAASDDGKALSLTSTDFSSTMSPSPNSESRRYSSPALSGQYNQQGTPSQLLQRQHQQLRRRQSNLRHMSVPGQPDFVFQSSANTQAQALQRYMDEDGDFSNMTAPSLTRQQQHFMAMSRAESPYTQNYGGSPMLERFMTEDGQAQVIDLRGHSPPSDVQYSQHYLGNSPGSGRGHHNNTTPNIFQSPRQPKPLHEQNLALQHLSSLPLNYAPASQREFDYSMKKENSSPESASAALRKLKRESHHAGGRRAGQGYGSQSSSTDTDDQRLIDAMYFAMMDTTAAQDNPGMVKTWNGLMKEKIRVRKVCETVLETCYKLEGNGGPLQSAIKTQNTYDSINHRVHELCKAFKAQKTMCKHLMEAPYIYQVVDDPILAANRVVNNRKVNSGKKKAIEAGREALKATKGGITTGDDAQDEDEDADGDDDDDFDQIEFQLPSSISPSVSQGPTTNKRVRQSVTSKISSEEPNDPKYGESPSKKVKHTSNSRYQSNERGELTDVGVYSAVRRNSHTTPQSQGRDRASGAHPHSASRGGYPMVIDNRFNAGRTAIDDATLHHHHGGRVGSGAFDDGFAGGFQGAYFGGVHRGRR